VKSTSSLFAIAVLAAGITSTASASEVCANVSDVTTIAAQGGCTVAPFSLGARPAGAILANYSVMSGGNNANASGGFAPFSGEIYIQQDIDYEGATAVGFVDSQTISEPMTFSLVGASLLGLGLLGRRLRK